MSSETLFVPVPKLLAQKHHIKPLQHAMEEVEICRKAIEERNGLRPLDAAQTGACYNLLLDSLVTLIEAKSRLSVCQLELAKLQKQLCELKQVLLPDVPEWRMEDVLRHGAKRSAAEMGDASPATRDHLRWKSIYQRRINMDLTPTVSPGSPWAQNLEGDEGADMPAMPCAASSEGSASAPASHDQPNEEVPCHELPTLVVAEDAAVKA